MPWRVFVGWSSMNERQAGPAIQCPHRDRRSDLKVTSAVFNLHYRHGPHSASSRPTQVVASPGFPPACPEARAVIDGAAERALAILRPATSSPRCSRPSGTCLPRAAEQRRSSIQGDNARCGAPSLFPATLPMVVGMKRARREDHELFWAARFGRVGQLRELLQQGAAVDSVDPSHGHSALTAAASSVCHTQPPWAAPSQYSRLTPPVSPSPAPRASGSG